MIDTVCLIISQGEVKIVNPNTWNLQSKTDGYSRYVKNPSEHNLETGKYFPRLSLYGRWFKQEACIRLEFSVPKLVFLNNLDEIEDTDFPLVITTLKERLETMGVTVSRETLENAKVSIVHFSKNIPLEDGYDTNYLIGEMNKINFGKIFDLTRAKYTNDGQSLYIHTASHELIIYNKVADILASEKRAIDRDRTPYQNKIFSEVEQKNKLPEVIRFEVRLVKKKKLNSMLKKFGYKENPTFKDVFSSALSKKIVIHYWKTIINAENSGLFSIPLSNKDLMQIIFTAQPNIKPKQVVYLTGLFTISKDGMRELRSIISKKSGERTWYRIAEDIRVVNELVSKNRIRSWVSQVGAKLEDYKPFIYKKI
jgi:hypothetical protein